MRILYLVHDLGDPAVARRIAMLEAGGATIELAGFRRGTRSACSREALELGVTHDARFLHRVVKVGAAFVFMGSVLARIARPDLILARNIETLVLGERIRARLGGNVPLVYECLDIHRLMLRDDIVGRSLRHLERSALERCAALITSSPAYAIDHFAAMGSTLPVILVENKYLELDSRDVARPHGTRAKRTGPFRIGLFGALRCVKSLKLLGDFTRAAGGTFELVMHGRPARTAINDFDRFVAAEPYATFGGAYEAEDIPDIYAEVDFAWAVDFFEEGLNARWTLPNRLYEGCANGAVPIAVAGSETARFMEEYGIGILLEEGNSEALWRALGTMSDAAYAALAARVDAVDRSVFVAGRAECEALVKRLATLGGSPRIEVLAA